MNSLTALWVCSAHCGETGGHVNYSAYSKRYQNLYMQIGLFWQLLQGSQWWLWVQQLVGNTWWFLDEKEGTTENRTFRTCWLCTNACLTVYWKLICFLPHACNSFLEVNVLSSRLHFLINALNSSQYYEYNRWFPCMTRRLVNECGRLLFCVSFLTRIKLVIQIRCI